MPRATDGFRVGFALCAAAWMCGCGRSERPPYPTWAPPESENAPSGAFEAYVMAAEQAESLAGDAARRVNFTPKMKRDLCAKLSPALGTVIRAGGPCAFTYLSRGPFEAPKHQAGWWLIGQCLAWRIEAAIVAENYGQAVADAVVATRFGIGLTGGSAMDASLGLSIVDRARRALAPHLPKLGASQLATLASGIESALNDRPQMSAVIRNERLNMLRAVQYVQDLYRDERLKELSKRLGTDVADAVAYLDQLHAKDKKRPAYFQGFADEAEKTCAYLQRLSTLNAEQRSKEPPLKLAEERPWWRFAKHFFGAVQPLLALKDATLARTRLLALEALVLRQVKISGAAPKDLSAFPETLIVDPYSGRAFVYRSEASEYHLYSVGPDLKDDGGETNESFTEPDLTVER